MNPLSELRPPRDVEARIVAGALDRIEARRPRMRVLPWLGAAAALAIVLIAVTRLDVVSDPPADLITILELPRPAYHVDAKADADLVTERDGDDGTDLFLGRGRAHFEVAKRRRGRFRVRTPSATVEVVGTGFTVEAQGLCTRVSVTHGVVRVTDADGARGVRLEAGTSDTRCLPEDTVEGEAWVAEAIRLVAANENTGRIIRLLERYRRLHPNGVFDQEALYFLAVAYVRADRRADGRAVAETLIERHPNTARAREVQRWFGL